MGIRAGNRVALYRERRRAYESYDSFEIQRDSYRPENDEGGVLPPSGFVKVFYLRRSNSSVMSSTVVMILVAAE